MNCKMLLFAMLAAPALCLATKLPFPRECTLLDRISTIAASQSAMSRAALGVLEQISLGRDVSIAGELEAKAGARLGEFNKPGFKDVYVRAYALRKIGWVGTPDAMSFLAKLRQIDLGPDDSYRVWPAAQIALKEARLRRISDPLARTEFLEKTILQPPQDASSRSKVKWWAITELCNNGVITSLPVIREAIRSLYSSTGEKEVQFCEARIEVIRRHPNRAKALGSVLKLNIGPDDHKLMWWAIYQLASLQSPEADAELERYRAEIDKLPEGSPAKRQAGLFRQTIRDLQAQSQANAIR